MLDRRSQEDKSASSSNIEAERFLVHQKIVADRRAEWRGEGRKFERHIFGEMAPIDRAFIEREDKILGTAKGFGKRVLPRQERGILDLVKEYQTGNPVSPHADYARNLREAIGAELEIKDAEMAERLRFYTATGGESAVDVKLGIDAFFVYEQGGKKYNLTMDATTNPDNPAKQIVNVDVVIGPEDVPNAEREPAEYVAEIKKMARKIAEIILKKIENEDYETGVYARPETSMVTAGRSRKIQEYIPEKKPPRPQRGRR